MDEERPLNRFSRFYLTGILAEVAEHCGIRAAERLAAAAGGGSKYIPQKRTGWLVKALGSAGALWFQGIYGGDIIAIPRGPYATPCITLTRAWKLRQNGKSTREIADALGICQRHASRIAGDAAAMVAAIDAAKARRPGGGAPARRLVRGD